MNFDLFKADYLKICRDDPHFLLYKWKVHSISFPSMYDTYPPALGWGGGAGSEEKR